MSHTNSELSFKFRFVSNGYAQGLFAQKGTANDREIFLGKETLIYDDITDTTTRDQRLAIAISSTACLSQKINKFLFNNSTLVLEVYNGKAQKLEKYLDRIASKKAVDKKRQRLFENGQFHLFRTANCPYCQATIDLSDFQRTPYIYCRFCETLFKENMLVITKGSRYRICDECHMFDRVKSYTEFYFYFLLVVYGFYYKRRHVCDNCAHSMFRKMLLLNLLFLIGIPFSIYNKIKSMIGRDPYLKQLAKANALSKKGNYQKATAIYSQLYHKYPEHPGLLMDEGLGHLLGNDTNGAFERFGRSLTACSNYYPVLRLLQQLQATGQQR